MYEVLEFLFQSPIIDDAVTATTKKVVGVALLIAPMLFLINLAHNYATTTMKNLGSRPKFFRWDEVARTLVIMFFIGIYIPGMNLVTTIGNSINEATVPTMDEALVGVKNEYGEYIEDVMGVEKKETETEEAEEDNDDSPSIWDFVFSPFSVGVISYFTNNMLNALTLQIVTVIRVIIHAFSMILVKIFFIIGPLALVFSILPSQKDKLAKWFNVYLNLLLVATTCNILDSIIYSNFFSSMFVLSAQNPLANWSFNIVIIVCYCLSYWITSFYVGSSGAGKVLSLAVTGATTIASSGLGAIGGGAKGVQGAASGAGKAAGGSKNSIEKN